MISNAGVVTLMSSMVICMPITSHLGGAEGGEREEGEGAGRRPAIVAGGRGKGEAAGAAFCVLLQQVWPQCPVTVVFWE